MEFNSFEEILQAQLELTQTMHQQMTQLSQLPPPTSQELLQIKEEQLSQIQQKLAEAEEAVRQYQEQIAQLEQEIQSGNSSQPPSTDKGFKVSRKGKSGGASGTSES